MKIATVLDSSLPVSIMRKQSGIISVVRRNVMVGEELPEFACAPGVPDGLIETLEDGSFLTKAPMTPNDVRRRYSKGRDFEVVFRKG
jgi:hypothetical protein